MSRLVIGNLKMNIVSKVERNNYFKSFAGSIRNKKFSCTKIILCPSIIHLESFVSKIKNKNVSFGAQNIYYENKGAYTGENSPAMVKNFGGEYVIIGHSERRKYFGETNKDVNKKIKLALKEKLQPVFCLGEKLEERENGNLKKTIKEQLELGLKNIPKNKLSKIIIAYEPIWSIGSGKMPTAEEVMEVQILIKKILIDSFSLNIKKLPKILYGGSVNYRNVEEVCIKSGMDGVLVGGESLHPVDFLKIVEIIDSENK
ncbi:MAG TPA: triose-phosphate isomerase [Candidatus Moranbacteria bacterium]|nr:triose-phosphate isomerase [Candidatus Moranbacteria bacterium]